ncbi:glycoside hydrolase family 10 protein [Nibrella viscosa]
MMFTRAFLFLCLIGLLGLTCRTAQTENNSTAPAEGVTISNNSTPADTTPIPPKREFRAVWIATVENMDWPSRKGLSPEIQQREFRELLDVHSSAGFNSVIVQVRAAADAFYAKSSEPWSEWLMGRQGQPPYPFYDPLEFMIKEAHSRNLEFHAWLNLDRATYGPKSSIIPTHISRRKPEWLITFEGKKLFNLGIPEVRAYIASIMANVVRQYDVDGIHFDDYFYPYSAPNQVLGDELTYKAYYNGMNIHDWRRDNVDKLILQLRDSIRAIKPKIKFGISPFGVWRNQKEDPEGSATVAGVTSYGTLYADTRKWIREGWIDYVAPQIYFDTEFERVPFRKLVDWWTQNKGKRHLYIGLAAYRIGQPHPRDKIWMNPSQMPVQMRYIRRSDQIEGSIFFSAHSIFSNPLGVRDSLRNNFFRYPALIPPMPWKDNIAPLPPRDLKVAPLEKGIELFWQPPAKAPDGDNATYYVVYRFSEQQEQRIDDPRNIIAICAGENTTRFLDKNVERKKRYIYVVTAFDRLHNESIGTSIPSPIQAL